MKKILSLFVTIALLTASMVYFTGCQNLMGTDAPSVETPKAQKHRITLARNGMTLEGGYAGETTYLILPNVMDTNVNPAYATVLWADITFKDAITDEILDIPVDIKNNCVYFTMPDRDIIFSAESVVESVSEGHESYANCEGFASDVAEIEKFKFGYYYKSEEDIDEELKSLVKKAKTSWGKDCWVYEITGWIDPSDCRVGDNWNSPCYFYVDGLVRYSTWGLSIFNPSIPDYIYNTNLCILTQDEKGNYNGKMMFSYPNDGDTPIEP